MKEKEDEREKLDKSFLLRFVKQFWAHFLKYILQKL